MHIHLRPASFILDFDYAWCKLAPVLQKGRGFLLQLYFTGLFSYLVYLFCRIKKFIYYEQSSSICSRLGRFGLDYLRCRCGMEIISKSLNYESESGS